MPYEITQCYLPPDRGDIFALTPAKAGTRFSDPAGMQDRFDLSTTAKVRSPCPRLHITVAFAINSAVHGEIRTLVLSHRANHKAIARTG